MNLTVEEAFNLYLNYVESKKKPQTYRTVKSRLKNHFVEFFSEKLINEITANDYLEWQKSIIRKNYRYKYMKGLHTCNVSFFNFLITYHGLDKNVAEQVGTFSNNRIEEEKTHILTKKEFRKFIRNVSGKEYQLFFRLLFNSGLRLGEAIALTWNDINLKDGTISVTKTISKENFHGTRAITSPKSKSSIRKVHINLMLRFRLINYKKYYTKKISNFNSKMYVFGFNKPLAPTTITRKKDQAFDRAGIKPIRIHDFRHSYASNLIEHGIPLEFVSKLLGHAKKSTTLDIYVHMDSKKEKRVLNILNFL